MSGALTRLRSGRRGGVLLALAAMVLMTLPTSATAAVGAVDGFGVTPMLMNLEVRPGRTVTTAITITNTTDAAMTYRLATEDIGGSKSDPNSSPILLGGITDTAISGARWIAPEANSVRVASGDSRDIEVKVAAPESATGGHYAALTVAAESRTIGAGVSATSRVAVLVFINAGSAPPPEIVIRDVVVTEAGETVIDYVNEGTTGTKPDATVTLTDPITGRTTGTGESSGGSGVDSVDEVGTGSSNCTYALPGAAGQCRITVHDKKGSLLQKGEVVLTNDGRTAKAPVPTEWTGENTSLLLPAVGVGLLAMYFSFLHRMRGIGGGRGPGAGGGGEPEDLQTLLAGE